MTDLRESMWNLALQPIAYGQSGEDGDLIRGDPTVKATRRFDCMVFRDHLTN